MRSGRFCKFNTPLSPALTQSVCALGVPRECLSMFGVVLYGMFVRSLVSYVCVSFGIVCREMFGVMCFA